MQPLSALVVRTLLANVTFDGESDELGNFTVSTNTPEAPEDSDGDGDIQTAAALAVLMQIFLLAAALVLGQLFERSEVTWMSEAGASLLLGVLSGVLAKLGSDSATFKDWMRFQPEFFFLGLLPPIIFEAGYSLEVKPFFSNIGGICAFAFLGTTISTFVIGISMWLFGVIGIAYQMPLLVNLMFGSIVSATDPVTVLSVFQKLNANQDLYSLVFGESVLNDAVAIVLYNTLSRFLGEDITAASVFEGFGIFIIIFVGSMATGIVFGILAALLFKTGWLRGAMTPLESGFVVLMAYSSYYSAEALSLSPIVSILFCGVVMAKYARPNLSARANARSGSFFKLIAYMAETFVFLYIGATLFLEEQGWDSGLMWAYLFLSLLTLAYSRALNVFPLSALCNVIRPHEQAIPKKHQFMLWFSGLRGAIAFALSLEASNDIEDKDTARVLLTCTFFIVLLTVLFNGGACTYLLNRLKLRASDDEPTRLELQHLYSGEIDGEDGCGANGSTSSPDLLPSSMKPPSKGSILMLNKVKEFNRSGGLAARFDPVHKVLSNFLMRESSRRKAEELELSHDDDLGGPSDTLPGELERPSMRLRKISDSCRMPVPEDEPLSLDNDISNSLPGSKQLDASSREHSSSSNGLSHADHDAL